MTVIKADRTAETDQTAATAAVEQVEGDPSLLLHYRSERAGLAPMVVGLLKGLGKRFSQQLSVRQTAFRGSDDHDIFRIDYVAAEPSPAGTRARSPHCG